MFSFVVVAVIVYYVFLSNCFLIEKVKKNSENDPNNDWNWSVISYEDIWSKKL